MLPFNYYNISRSGSFYQSPKLLFEKKNKDNTDSCSYKQNTDKENDMNSESPNKIVDYENKQPKLKIKL